MVNVRAGVIVMLFGFAGIIIAFIEKTLYDNGVLVTALSNMGVTLAEAMALTIIVWLLVGAIIGLSRG
jgi:hypothetical protein